MYALPALRVYTNITILLLLPLFHSFSGLLPVLCLWPHLTKARPEQRNMDTRSPHKAAQHEVQVAKQKTDGAQHEAKVRNAQHEVKVHDAEHNIPASSSSRTNDHIPCNGKARPKPCDSQPSLDGSECSGSVLSMKCTLG